jgi:NitT/TauT family transport system ATP-binding protein
MNKHTTVSQPSSQPSPQPPSQLPSRSSSRRSSRFSSRPSPWRTAADSIPSDQSRTGAQITLTGVELGYPGRPVLSGVDLTVLPGEVLTIVGPSGCGKSTLLRGVAGLLRPTRGRIALADRTLDGPGADRAMVFQDDALLPWHDVQRNIEFPLRLANGDGLARAERRALTQSWIERVGLAGFEHRLPRQLSGGMRQRVQLARALIGRPPTLLMDEPFGALDPATRTAMQTLLIEVWQQNRPTVMFVTHDIDEAVALGDRVAVLTGGGIGRLIPVPAPREPGVARDELRAEVLTALNAREEVTA